MNDLVKPKCADCPEHWWKGLEKECQACVVVLGEGAGTFAKPLTKRNTEADE